MTDSVTEAVRLTQEAIRSDGVNMSDDYDRGYNDGIEWAMTKDPEIERLRAENKALSEDLKNSLEDASLARSQLVSVKRAGNQALRQWKMYAENEERENFETEETLEGAEYRWCKSALSDD